MTTMKARLFAAKERLMSRYPDRDEVEVRRVTKSFKGMTSEQLREQFEREAAKRGIKIRDNERTKNDPNKVLA